MSAVSKLPPTMTVAEFFAWAPRDAVRWELVDGIPGAMAPASPGQGAIQAEAARLIGNHLTEHRPACRVIIEPGIQPRMHADYNVRVPDLAVSCAPWDADGPPLREPVLLLEVLSPSNHSATRANVLAYTTIPSVREVLVLHSTVIRGELLRRGPDGIWPDSPQLLMPGDFLALRTIDFMATLNVFYRTAGL